MTTNEQDVVKEARELLGQITQGEWVSDMDSNAVKTVHGQWIAQLWSKDESDFDNFFRNREFIARAPELIKTLCDEVEERRREVKTLELMVGGLLDRIGSRNED